MKIRKVENVRFFWAVNGKPKQWLLAQQKDFPTNDLLIDIPFDAVKHDGSFWGFAKQMPGFIIRSHRLRKFIGKLVTEHDIHGIISDHQLGAWHKDIPCILIAHQLRLPVFQKFTWLSSIIDRFHSGYINQFKEVWIPDVEGKHNLSGKLSNASLLKIPHRHIGWLSHLAEVKLEQPTSENKYELLGMVSGPEPFRNILAKELMNILKKQGKKNALISGDYLNESNKNNNSNLTYYYAVNSEEIKHLIRESSLIIATGGYSTLMDLMIMRKPAILIPTPGQPEQAYLAKYLQDYTMFHFTTLEELKQLDFDKIKSKLTDPLEIDETKPIEKEALLGVFNKLMAV
ncbi:MAG: glycosyltransferase family protein [Flavobacteriales bacterium]